jgi:hypothetical protein
VRGRQYRLDLREILHPVDTKNTDKRRDTGVFYTEASTTLPGTKKPAKMIMLSVLRSEIEPVVCSMCRTDDSIDENRQRCHGREPNERFN